MVKMVRGFIFSAAIIALCACGSAPESDTLTGPLGEPVFPNAEPPGPYTKAYSMTENMAGDTRIFVQESPGQTSLYAISQDAAGVWSAPYEIDLPKIVSNTSPHFSPFNDHLFYASDAPLPNDSTRRDMNIWSVEWSDGSWGTPEPVSGDVNSTDNETGVTTDEAGNMYFVSKHARGQGAQDIYTATIDASGDWKTVFLPEHINSPRVDSHVAITPDGGTLIFYSYRAPKLGKVDLFVARKTDNGWLGPVNLGEAINTPGEDFGAGFSQNGQTFFWSQNGVLMQTERARFDELSDLAFANLAQTDEN